ncbi:MAG: DnaD domain protein [Dehalococcoidales bacterium]|nr:DnaD domain protein [Dehalococcoidales bacterium]
MKKFEGFPSRMQFTSVPNLFLSRLMPEIDDITELKISFHIFRIIYAKKGYPRFVTFNELLADNGVIDCLPESEGELTGVLSEILDKIVDRAAVIRLDFEKEGNIERLYFLNTGNDRKAIEKIEDGILEIKGLKRLGRPHVYEKPEPQKDIFALYEDNIGLLSPMVADGLKEAEKNYPDTWIRDAIKEAVSLNKRNWRYIERILENWSAEGRSDGTHRGNTKTDPSKYRKQKYDHLVRH